MPLNTIPTRHTVHEPPSNSVYVEAGFRSYTNRAAALCNSPCQLVNSAVQAAAELDASTKLPGDAGGQQPAELVVGSLDVNQGAVLPAEELVGRQPTVSWCSVCIL